MSPCQKIGNRTSTYLCQKRRFINPNLHDSHSSNKPNEDFPLGSIAKYRVRTLSRGLFRTVPYLCIDVQQIPSRDLARHGRVSETGGVQIGSLRSADAASSSIAKKLSRWLPLRRRMIFGGGKGLYGNLILSCRNGHIGQSTGTTLISL